MAWVIADVNDQLELVFDPETPGDDLFWPAACRNNAACAQASLERDPEGFLGGSPTAEQAQTLFEDR